MRSRGVQRWVRNHGGWERSSANDSNGTPDYVEAIRELDQTHGKLNSQFCSINCPQPVPGHGKTRP